MKKIGFYLAGLLILSLLAGVPQSVRAQDQAPEGVTLDYFIATADYPDHILLEWQSVSELNTQAYRISRSTTPNPAQAILIASYVPAHPGSSFGYYYSLEDDYSLVDGTTYYYWIEDEELNSPGTWYFHTEYNPIVVWGFVCSRYDFDCNQVVNSLDLAAAAGRWNCILGNACFDPLYDVNDDDRVDIVDLGLVGPHWGCSFGEPCYG